MGSAQRPDIFTIPLHCSFADALAAGVTRIYGGDGLALASGMILLPNNRAATAVRDAFIRLSGGALLLPRLVALGDVDLDASAGGALDRIDAADPLPPTIAPMQRRFLLARMIAHVRPDTPVGEALRLAETLAATLDQLAIEEIALPELLSTGKKLSEENDLAGHWQQAFDLLQTLAKRWPDELARVGAIERTALRNHVLDATARRWREQGLPVPFLVAAGITTSAPVVARLLRVIAFAPGGSVVLPHVDSAMPDAQWDALGGVGDDADDAAPKKRLETHPQFHLKLLLDRMGVARGEVATWPDSGALDGPDSRSSFASHLLAPAEFTAAWPDLPMAQRRLPGVTAYECAIPAEEALTIALALRETLETPGRTAALVTPDRAIATRVAGHLARWGIAADDSAGQPLAMTPAGDLLLALAAAASSGFAPVELIALLSHPLVQAGDERRAWSDRVRDLDKLLRGPRPAPGLAAIAALIADPDKRADPALSAWWGEVSDHLAALAARIDPRSGASLVAVLAGLRAGLDALAGDAVWANADGRALSTLFADMERHAADLPGTIQPGELVAMLRLVMAEVGVRPPQGGHPRLFIWGLIEARLQRADRMILAGLNEGQWPQAPSPDPWLPPVVRRKLGLPGLDWQTGLSSHDFATALGAPEVILTRSLREGTAPTVASRLRLRIDALIGDADALRAKGTDHRAIAAALDACANPQPVRRPAPVPFAEHRPKRISVTEVDTLLADPFAFYARAGLGLFRLDPLDAEPSAAWRGTAVHDVLERWLKGGERSVERIEQLTAELLAGPGISPMVRALWAPRLRAPLRWAAQQIINQIREERREPVLAASEEHGKIEVDGVELRGKPDRIDRLADGTLAVVDYKSGSGPSKASVEALFSLQLGLLAAMVDQDGFGIGRGVVSTFEYWRMNRKPNSDSFGWIDSPFYKATKTSEPKVHAGIFVGDAFYKLETAVGAYLTGTAPFTARVKPEYAKYADYDQLMRFEEWYGQEGSAMDEDAP